MLYRFGMTIDANQITLTYYTIHITLYDIAFIGTLFVALTFLLLLWFARGNNKTANRFLYLCEMGSGNLVSIKKKR